MTIRTGYKKTFIYVLLFFLLIIFYFFSFKNISYPLFWNDEAETAMFGKRILGYGYPKVYDGKNVLNLTDYYDVTLGVNERFDAWVGADWAQYYLAAVGVYFADSIDDLYFKTAIVRLPFILIGIIGLVVLVLTFISFFSKFTLHRSIFIILFVALNTISVPLILHLRQARYYPLLLFAVALVIYIFTRYQFLKQYSYKIYSLLLVATLLLNFVIFYPAYFAVVFSLGLYLILSFLISHSQIVFQDNRTLGTTRIILPQPVCLPDLFWSLLPLFLSFISVVPLMVFFKKFQFASALSQAVGFSFFDHLNNIFHALSFFTFFGFLVIALILKTIACLLYYGKLLNKNVIIKKCFDLSVFLTIFFTTYILVISRIPYPYFFQRYFIILQPILNIIIIMDLFIVISVIRTIKLVSIEIVHGRYHPFTGRQIIAGIFFITAIIFLIEGWPMIQLFRNYGYELTHQYKGPLDAVIPYIKERYKNPENLVIATNYEEHAYMFYLDSKVIVGFVRNNLVADMKLQPDIIIIRKGWANSQQPLLDLLKKDHYQQLSFPIFDYWVNNIPETSLPIKHLFRTPVLDNAIDRENRMTIYLKQLSQ